jgi:hypothetical protein
MNNLALFVTHSIFLTEEQIESLLRTEGCLEVVGHCVPVWVNAKTGETTEPGSEVFCNYKIHNSGEKVAQISNLRKKGFEIFLPGVGDWVPPADLDLERMSVWSSEERMSFLKERDKWWFNNPRPPSADQLKNGYLRFEVKKIKQKTKKHQYSAQHIVEIANMGRLVDSLTI